MMTINPIRFNASSSGLPHRREQVPSFSGRGTKADVYQFQGAPTDTIRIPAEQKAKFVTRLNELTRKIQAGDYIVEPASGKYKGIGKNFNIGSKESNFGPDWLMSGEFIIRPRPATETEIREVILKRSRGRRVNKVLTVEIRQHNAPTLVYQQKGGIYDSDSIVPFMRAVCAEINKVLRNEQKFEPDLLDNLKF